MNKEEKIKAAVQTGIALDEIVTNLKRGNPVELKIEKGQLVVVDIERHAKVKVDLGN